ncbi:MAG TPA: heavy-metal-associated domain-containing protein [Thermomicrobiales bacterium]|nr:heavy-metal-associated domain-containing protein [Thermomicrobiales bacterium]
METVTLNAPDISCGHCVATVEEAVGKVNGVQSVTASADSKDVNVTYDASQIDVSAIAAALDEAGYPAKQ